jgi:hypothetical protein
VEQTVQGKQTSGAAPVQRRTSEVYQSKNSRGDNLAVNYRGYRIVRGRSPAGKLAGAVVATAIASFVAVWQFAQQKAWSSSDCIVRSSEITQPQCSQRKSPACCLACGLEPEPDCSIAAAQFAQQ